MPIGKIFRTIGVATTLGAASLIYSASGSEKKSDAPLPTKAQKEQTQDDFLKLDSVIRTLQSQNSKNETIINVANFLTKQFETIGKLRSNITNIKQLDDIQKREIKLVNAAKSFMDEIPLPIESPNYKYWIEGTSSIFKSLSENVISRTNSPDVIDSGFDLFFKINRLPECGNPENKEMKKFINETAINVLFKSLLESTNRLSKYESERIKEKIYQKIENGDPFYYRFYGTGYKNEFMIDGIVHTIGEKLFTDKTLNEFNLFTNTILFKDIDFDTFKTSHNFRRAIVLKTIDSQKEKLANAVQKKQEDLKSTDEKKQLEAISELLTYKNTITKVLSKYHEPTVWGWFTKHISNEELKRTSNFIEQSISKTDELLLNNLSNLNITVERIPNNHEHIIHTDVFYANLMAIKPLLKDSKDSRNNLVEMIYNRLKGLGGVKEEKDLRNRGMLYEALGTVLLYSETKEAHEILGKLRDGIVKEEPLVSQKIGEAIAEKIFHELTYDGYIPPVIRSRAGETTRTFFIREFAAKVKDLNEVIGTSKNGETPVTTKNQAHYLLAEIISASRGRNKGLSYFFKESKGYHSYSYDKGNFFAITKDQKTVNIDEDLKKIVTGSNVALGGFSKRLVEKINSNEFAEIKYHFNDYLGLNKTLEHTTDILEKNLRRSFLHSAPYIAVSLIPIYSSNLNDFDSDKKIVELNKSIFKGQTRFSTFDKYEEFLLAKCVEKYRESLEMTKETFKKDTTCGHLWNKLDRFGPFNSLEIATKQTSSVASNLMPISPINNFGILMLPFQISEVSLPTFSLECNKKQYDEIRKELHEELRRVAPKLYLETVRNPWEKTKINSTRIFLDFAGSRKREPNLQILLSPDGLLNGIRVENLRTLLDEIDEKR